MRAIKLKHLTLKNFKGCRERELDFGDITDIYGANASGKTTIADGFAWLLFNRDTTGSTGFGIRPLDADGKTVDNVDICVTAVLEADGAELTLSKTQKQVWTKKRGSDTATLTGNQNTYEINGFPAKETEYKAKVAELVDDRIFKLITDPRAFASLPWKDQRSILTEFIKGVTDADVAAMKPVKYGSILHELAQAPVDKCIEKAKKAMAALKDKQKELPARIDEANNAVIAVADVTELKKHRDELNIQLADVLHQRDDASAAFKAVSDIQAEVMQTKLDMGDVERKANDTLRQKRREANQWLDDLTETANQVSAELMRKQGELTRRQAELDGLKADLDRLSDEYRAAKKMQFDEASAVCSMCGQALPADKVKELKADFETRKQSTITRIGAEGEAKRKEWVGVRDKIDELQETITALKSQESETKNAKTAAQDELAALPDSVDAKLEPEYIALADKLAGLEAQLSQMDTGEKVRNELAAKEQGIRDELMGVTRQFAAVEANERTKSRIEELKTELRDVSQQVADQERKLYLLEELMKDKMELLSEQVNRRFGLVKFKLFETQINGGIKPTCEMTMNGVPYSDLNSAGKLQAGLDVIGALAKLYDVSAPIWLDNREAVINIPPVNAQLINLYVSAGDKELRVEVEQ